VTATERQTMSMPDTASAIRARRGCSSTFGGGRRDACCVPSHGGVSRQFADAAIQAELAQRAEGLETEASWFHHAPFFDLAYGAVRATGDQPALPDFMFVEETQPCHW
jgi:hypothetical protein